MENQSDTASGTPAARHPPTRGDGIARLQALMARLRAPDGCPWDREQTLTTLKPCLVEECYELLETMDGASPDAHMEELGDVLLQVVFQARIREEQGLFTLNDVAHLLADKLVRRHPHVFGDLTVDGTEDVLRNWEQIKQEEQATAAKPAPRSVLAGVPAALPALLRAQRVQAKASRVGFDWPDQQGPRGKIDEELAELDEAAASGDQQALSDEMGDLLFSVVNLCRFLKVDAEEALRQSTARFTQRFQMIERKLQATGQNMQDCGLKQLDALWEAAKAEQNRL